MVIHWYYHLVLTQHKKGSMNSNKSRSWSRSRSRNRSRRNRRSRFWLHELKDHLAVLKLWLLIDIIIWYWQDMCKEQGASNRNRRRRRSRNKSKTRRRFGLNNISVKFLYVSLEGCFIYHSTRIIMSGISYKEWLICKCLSPEFKHSTCPFNHLQQCCHYFHCHYTVTVTTVTVATKTFTINTLSNVTGTARIVTSITSTNKCWRLPTLQPSFYHS